MILNSLYIFKKHIFLNSSGVIGQFFISNYFMCFAQYGHVKLARFSLSKVILTSSVIAFFGNRLMVPANRVGFGQYNAFQLENNSIGDQYGSNFLVCSAIFKRKNAMKLFGGVGTYGGGSIFYF